MLGPIALVHVALPVAGALVAAFGAVRCWRLLRYGDDPRLRKLMWFYGLFATSLVSVAIWTARLALDVGEAAGFVDGHAQLVEAWGAALSGTERLDVFLVLHHGLLLASLGVAVDAFRARPAAAAGVAAATLVGALGATVLGALAVEAALALYLAIRAIINHHKRKTPGALQVAAGFLLFFAGHLGYFLFHEPAVARTPLGDLAALLGLILLVRLLPRPTG